MKRIVETVVIPKDIAIGATTIDSLKRWISERYPDRIIGDVYFDQNRYFRQEITFIYENKDAALLYREQFDYFLERTAALSISFDRPRSMQSEGMCPECGQQVADWKPKFGSFAPEIWQTYREMGINPSTGHRLNCRYVRQKAGS